MFPPPQWTGQAPSSRGAPRVPPGPPGNHPVNWPTSSRSTPPPQPPSGAPGRHPTIFPTKQFQPPAELRITNVAAIADLTPLPEMSYDKYDAAHECDNSLVLGSAEGKPPFSLKQTDFSLKQFAKRMGQPSFCGLNNWNKVWVAEFLKKKHRSIFREQNWLKQGQDGPLHWEIEVAHFLVTFENWLPLVNSDNAEWIRQQWVGIFFKKCVSEIPEARIKRSRGNKRPGKDLGECAGKNARSNIPELPNTRFTVMIQWVSNGEDMVLASKQLQALYTAVRYWEELVDFINKNGGPQEPIIHSSMIKRTLVQDKLKEEYVGLYIHGQMINDPIYGQILYNCCLSNAFKLKLGHNMRIFLV